MRSLNRRLLLLPFALSIGIATAPPAFAEQTTGSVSGHITTSTGEPAAWAHINLLSASGTGMRELLAGGDGSYELTGLRPGGYKLNVEHAGVQQYAHQKLTFAEGELFTVEAGKDTVIDEKMFEPGAIAVKVVDSKTGKPVETACVTLPYKDSESCTPDDGGVFRFGELGRKSDYMIDARAADGLHMRGRVSGIAVELGRTTEVTVKLDPAAAITTKVVDRATGEPVGGACVTALSTYFGGLQAGYCPETSDEPAAESADDGTVRIGEIPAGERRLFVMPNDGVHGIQWVGAKGGTGSQYKARKISAVPGKVSALPPIRLDPQGSLSGNFVDASGGPLESTGYCATVMPGRGDGLPPGSTCDGSDGSFTIDGLGPYKWPVGFLDPWGSPYGIQWPGGRLDRKSARTHQVTAGATADIGSSRILKGRTFATRVVQADGTPWPGTRVVTVFNARTGDYLGDSRSREDIAPVIGQSVKLRVYAEGHGVFWFRNATGFRTGQTIRLRSDKDTALDIVVPRAAR